MIGVNTAESNNQTTPNLLDSHLNMDLLNFSQAVYKLKKSAGSKNVGRSKVFIHPHVAWLRS